MQNIITEKLDMRKFKGQKVQVIGDQIIINPRTRVVKLINSKREVVIEFEHSYEVCGCGVSMARPGVGYWSKSGWLCKRCGQLHTLHNENEMLHPDSTNRVPNIEMINEYDKDSFHDHKAYDGENVHEDLIIESYD